MLLTLLSEFRIYLANRVVCHVPFHALRQAYYRHVMGYRLGTGCAILLGVSFDAARGLSLGTGSVINQDCRIDTRGGISIGDHVSISPEVMILTAGHDLQALEDFRGKERPVVIGHRVFIGARALILPGLTLGDGCAVAAGAVVTRDVPPGVVVAGVPARPIGQRPAGLCYRLDYRRWFH